MTSDAPLNSAGDERSHQVAARRRLIIRAPSFSWANLTNDVAKLASYKDLLYTLSAHRIKVRYKQSLLGVTWAIIQPLSMMLIFTAIFSYIVRVPSEGIPYALFAYAGILPWNYFSTSVANSTNGLVSHSNLITKVYFPREILPLSYVFASLFDFLIASSILVGLLFYYRVRLTANAAYVVPVLAILTLFIIGAALLLSAAQVRYRDIGVAVPLLLQVWMFATPVVYPLSEVPARYRPIYVLNPMVGIIENFRRALLHGAPPDVGILTISALSSMLLLFLAYVYFKRVEATMADII
jgi:lipopolysaccharide transport system permease protein